jgi:hypothetical protein
MRTTSSSCQPLIAGYQISRLIAQDTQSLKMGAWVCKNRIAGVVYNSSSTACGHCSANRDTAQDYVVFSNLPENRKLAWVLKRIEAGHEQKPTSLHLPLRQRRRVSGHNFARKSGVFFVFLRALGFDWDTAYRTAYQAIRWVKHSKVLTVLNLLKDSGELEQICAEAQQIYEV